MTTLNQARQQWRDTIHKDGGVCPCCDRWGKVYGRGINATMAASLEWLYTVNLAKGLRTWIDVPNTAPKSVVRSNQLATLRWWGLVERQSPSPDDKSVKHTGMWRITLRGMDFVEGKILIPKKVFTYNGEVVSFGSEEVAFAECKGKFDFAAIMATQPETEKLTTLV